MKNISLLFLVLTYLIYTGCNNSPSGTKTGGPAVTAPSTPQNIIVPNSATQQNAPSTTASSTAEGLNPAHGQPGHRCDIAVGSPLNSKPAATTTTSPSVQPVVSQPVISPAPTTATAPGMNPAHGQPGHRCDIAVGSPLNSKPATPTTASPSVQPVVSQPVISSAPTTATAPGMNPAHGQPGHRCDIPVGSPLNSPPSASKPTGITTPISISPEVKKQ